MTHPLFYCHIINSLFLSKIDSVWLKIETSQIRIDIFV